MTHGVKNIYYSAESAVRLVRIRSSPGPSVVRRAVRRTRQRVQITARANHGEKRDEH